MVNCDSTVVYAWRQMRAEGHHGDQIVYIMVPVNAMSVWMYSEHQHRSCRIPQNPLWFACGQAGLLLKCRLGP